MKNFKYIKNNFAVLSFLVFINCCFFSCKKFIDVSPPKTFTTGDNIYTSDASAAAVLTGLYTLMSTSSATSTGGIGSLSLKTGLSSDELKLYSGSTNQNLIRFYRNSLNNQTNETFWENLYLFIYATNGAIEGLDKSNSLTPSVKLQLLGEAKFLRAFYYFYLVNLYGDVPLVVTTDYRTNASFSRSSKSDVYSLIISDLKDAQMLLKSDYVNADAMTTSTERVRPSKWAATALLARAYLFTGDWANAEIQSASIINNNSLYSLVSDLNNVFKKNSSEAIWQLQPVNTGWNTEDARVFILTGAPNSSRPVYINTFLLNAFEAGDNRRTKWVNSRIASGVTYYYPYKYQSATSGASVTEYLMVLRVAEQFLIRAEARAKLNNLSGAIADLDMIRQRAGLSLIVVTNPSINQSALLTAILHERQVELFTEWGHRWIDIKRTNSTDAVMTVITPIKGGTWSSNWQWYPLPFYDIQQNTNLVQNTGY